MKRAAAVFLIFVLFVAFLPALAEDPCARGHRFGEWYINPGNRDGMLQRKCKVCRTVEYRYCDPLNVDDFPVAEVVANAARYADGHVSVLHEEALLTPDELNRIDALSAHDRVLVVLYAAGFGEQADQLQLGGDLFSAEAQALRDGILARIDSLTGADMAAYQDALQQYFPKQVISMDPTKTDYRQVYLSLVFSGEEERTENYGFCRNNRKWSFRRIRAQQ